jgi:hypothetical protein
LHPNAQAQGGVYRVLDDLAPLGPLKVLGEPRRLETQAQCAIDEVEHLSILANERTDNGAGEVGDHLIPAAANHLARHIALTTGGWGCWRRRQIDGAGGRGVGGRRRPGVRHSVWLRHDGGRRSGRRHTLGCRACVHRPALQPFDAHGESRHALIAAGQQQPRA